MSRARDYELMARALRLAANGVNTTRPNPTVACVLERDGLIVGEGWTAPAGGPHAEIAALREAGERARGATAYVTLEPCSHTGRTGPCSEALIEARVARVVCPMLDPNPLVGGRGVAALRAAGIEVDVGILAAAAHDVNRGFFARMTRKRPWVRSKLAASLDGRTALANGESRWITGAAARRDVHRWRARAGAVMTGIGTLLADDPALTARPEEPGLAALQPLRVVVDAQLRTPPGARTLTLPGRVVIFTTRTVGAGLAIGRVCAGTDVELEYEPGGADVAMERATDGADVAIERARGGAEVAIERGTGGAEVAIERVPGGAHCDLTRVLERLAELEINDVWVEAGPGLNGALLAAGLVDELVIYMAPRLFGDSARGMFSLEPLAALGDAVEVDVDDVRRVGTDLRILARPRNARS